MESKMLVILEKNNGWYEGYELVNGTYQQIFNTTTKTLFTDLQYYSQKGYTFEFLGKEKEAEFMASRTASEQRFQKKDGNKSKIIAISSCFFVDDCIPCQDDECLRFSMECPKLELSFSDMDKEDARYITENYPSYDPRVDVPIVLTYDHILEKYFVECDTSYSPEYAVCALGLNSAHYCKYPKRVTNDELDFLVSKCQDFVKEKTGLTIEEYAEQFWEKESDLSAEKE